MTIRQQLLLIRQQQDQMIRLLSLIARQNSASSCLCLPPGTQFPSLPQFPVLPPTLPDTPYTPGGDPVLCRRIQREIDNIITVWEQALDVATIAGTVTVAGLAALIGTALAPESAGMSAVGMAMVAAGITALIAEAGSEIGSIPLQTRQNAARAAYSSRGGGAQAASTAALGVLRSEQPVIVTEGAFVALWTVWGGLRRAFDSSIDIGDISSYPNICSEDYGHISYADYGDPQVERIYVWGEPIVMSNYIPNVTPDAIGPSRYFRNLPEGTILRNNSPHSVVIAVWNYAGVLTLNTQIPPGGARTLPSVNGGYVSSSPGVLCPPGTLVFTLP